MGWSDWKNFGSNCRVTISYQMYGTDSGAGGTVTDSIKNGTFSFDIIDGVPNFTEMTLSGNSWQKQGTWMQPFCKILDITVEEL